jgi:mRNA-degrading endonuclease toxin of MazEF toxin-antitoxin module
MKRGEIWLVWFPFSRLVSPPEQYKKRPVLVLANTGTPPDQAILVAMVTGNQQRLTVLGPGDVPIAAWAAAGLVKASTVRSRRLWTAEGRDFAIKKKLGDVEPTVVQHVLANVRGMLS